MTEKPNENADFEQELRRALHPVAPPETLLADVLSRVEPRRKPLSRLLAFPAKQAWIGSLAASLLVAALALGGVERRHANERAQAEKDFARSLEITDRAMTATRERLQKAGVSVD